MDIAFNPHVSRPEKTHLLVSCVVLIACLATANVTVAADDDDGRDLTNLYKKAKSACLEVHVNGRIVASGWIADPSGLAFTSFSATEGEEIEVSGSFGRVDAKIVAVDRGPDLVVVQLPKRDKPYPFLRVAKKAPPVGRDLYLYGIGIGRHGLMLPGRVARAETGYEFIRTEEYQGYIHVFYVAGSSPWGMSGGPWMNAQGEVVGGQSAMMLIRGVPVEIAFVAPRDSIAALLKNKSTTSVATLGCAFEELTEQQSYFIERFPKKTRGLVARVVFEDGPLDKSVIRELDVIVAIDGKPVQLRNELVRYVRSKKAGTEVEIQYLRPDDSEKRTTKLKIGKLENH